MKKHVKKIPKKYMIIGAVLTIISIVSFASILGHKNTNLMKKSTSNTNISMSEENLINDSSTEDNPNDSNTVEKNNKITINAFSYDGTLMSSWNANVRGIGTVTYEIPNKWIKFSDLQNYIANENIPDDYYRLSDVFYGTPMGATQDFNDWYLIYNEEKDAVYINDQFVPDENTSPNEGWAENYQYPFNNMMLYYGKKNTNYNYVLLDWNDGVINTGGYLNARTQGINSLSYNYGIYNNGTRISSTPYYTCNGNLLCSGMTQNTNIENVSKRLKGFYTPDNKQWNFNTDTVTKDIILHAEWYYTFTVNFDVNGGDGSVASKSVVTDTLIDGNPKNKKITLPDIGNTTGPIDDKTGKISTFLGWSEDKEGRSKVRKPGEEYTIPTSGEKTLYAIWSNNYIDTLYIQAVFSHQSYLGSTTKTTRTKTIKVNVPKKWTKLSDLTKYIDYESLNDISWNVGGLGMSYKILTKDDFRVTSVTTTNDAVDLNWHIIMNDKKGVPYISSDTSFTPDDKTSPDSGWYDEEFSWPYNFLQINFDEKTDYIVTLDPNGGTFTDGTTDNKEHHLPLYSSSSTDPIPSLKETDNIKFKGWYSEDGTLYTEEMIKEIKKDIKLTARWEGTYNIVFDLNGASKGETPASINNISSGDTITLPTESDFEGPIDNFTNKNATFIGWSECELGNAGDKEIIKNKIYPAGSEYTVKSSYGNGEIKLYAIWSAYNYKNDDIYFTIKEDGVIPDDEPASQQQGTDVYTYIKNSENDIGFDGMGWGKASDVLKTKKVSVIDYSNNDNKDIINTLNLDKIPTAEDIKKYVPDFNPETQEVLWYVVKLEDNIPETAGWHVDGVIRYKKSYSLTYDKGTEEEVTNMPSNQTKIMKDHEVTISSTIPQRYGYKFMGWKTEDITINNNKFTMPAKNVTLVAQWEKITTPAKANIVLDVGANSTLMAWDSLNYTISYKNESNEDEDVQIIDYLSDGLIHNGYLKAYINKKEVKALVKNDNNKLIIELENNLKLKANETLTLEIGAVISSKFKGTEVSNHAEIRHNNKITLTDTITNKIVKDKKNSTKNPNTWTFVGITITLILGMSFIAMIKLNKTKKPSRYKI